MKFVLRLWLVIVFYIFIGILLEYTLSVKDPIIYSIVYYIYGAFSVTFLTVKFFKNN